MTSDKQDGFSAICSANAPSISPAYKAFNGSGWVSLGYSDVNTFFDNSYLTNIISVTPTEDGTFSGAWIQIKLPDITTLLAFDIFPPEAVVLARAPGKIIAIAAAKYNLWRVVGEYDNLTWTADTPQRFILESKLETDNFRILFTKTWDVPQQAMVSITQVVVHGCEYS